MSGMTYRPITDTWILGRCKHGYHGGFAVGFLERARELLPVTSDEGIWHFCSGRVQDYKGKVGGIPLKGFSKNDLTFDVNANVKPDFVVDLRHLDEWAVDSTRVSFYYYFDKSGTKLKFVARPRAILIDRPYDEENHNEYVKRYGCPPGTLPNPNELVRQALRIVQPGGRVAMLDFVHPRPGKNFKETAIVNVHVGQGTRPRILTVWKER